MTATPTPVEHRDAMLDVFTEISSDCAQLDLRPVGLHVNIYLAAGSVDVDVQFLYQDTASVDVLAEAYGFDPDDGETGCYERSGRLDVDGRRVRVTVYTGRPAVAA